MKFPWFQFFTSLRSSVFQKIKVGITKQWELSYSYFLDKHNNLPGLRLHLYSVILHSDRSRSRSRSFCNQFLFFVVLNFLSSLTTCILTWYLAFLTKGDMLTTHNPHFTKIFTYFRPVSQKKKKKTPKSNFQFCLFFVVLSQLMSLAIVHKRKWTGGR